MAIYNNERDPNVVDNEKQIYTYKIDRKISMWISEDHQIEANSKEEADAIMIKAFQEDDYPDTFQEQEELYDTMEDMLPEDNDGNATMELIDEDHRLLASNEKEISKII